MPTANDSNASRCSLPSGTVSHNIPAAPLKRRVQKMAGAADHWSDLYLE